MISSVKILVITDFTNSPKHKVRFSLKSLPVMIASYILNVPICMISQIYGLIRCGDQHHWAKTEHAIVAQMAENRQHTALRKKAA